MSIILDGKSLSNVIAQKLEAEIKGLHSKVCLAIVQVGDSQESTAFINQKKKFGEKIGVEVRHLHFAIDIQEIDLIQEISKLNDDASVSGIIVQLPLPQHIQKENIINTIEPSKDVDGLTATSLRKLMENTKGLVPATARGIVSLLEHYEIPIEGKNVVIIGRSVLVGKSTAMLFLNKNATVTICHSHTKNISQEVAKADIVVVAAGFPGLLTVVQVNSSQVIIDVGINITTELQANGEEKRKIEGDVSFEEIKNNVFAITPVPGGVGPMTVASLFQNLFDAHVWINNKV